MRTSQAARFARWAALAAVAIAALAAVVYIHRQWQAARVRRNAPPVVPSTVQQSSNEFSFSKVENDRTLFTVRASRATEFKEQHKSLLDDVWITVYGRQGNRNDNIHTRQCNYEPSTGRIGCEGDVQLDLQSADQARAKSDAHAIHVETRAIIFDRTTGIAATEQPVFFRFLYGEGRGVGAAYSTGEATIALQHDVELTLHGGSQPFAPSAAPRRASEAQPIILSGRSLTYHSTDHQLQVSGPVHIKQGDRELLAGAVILELDQELRVRHVLVEGEPKLISTGPLYQSTIQAERFVGFFHPQGWVESLGAEGHVRGSRKTPAGQDQFAAQRLEVQMNPGDNQPRQITAQGQVDIRSMRGAVSQNLQTDGLRLFLVSSSSGQPAQIDHAETLAPARLERKSQAESSTLLAQRLTATFGQRHQIRQLMGKDGIEISRQTGTAPVQTSASREVAVDYADQGEWTQVQQSGHVRMQQGDRSATSDHARFVRSTDTIELTGSATVADSQSHTTAQSIWFRQQAGEVHAQGGVNTSYFAAQHGPANLPAEPANIHAETLQANSATGQALYSGHARWWQSSAVVEADSITLFRDEQKVEAQGGVHGAFPQASATARPTQKPAESKFPGVREGATSAKTSSPAKQTTKLVLWRFRAVALTYWGRDRRAYLHGGVHAESGEESIDAEQMDLFMDSTSTGPAQLSRASASGRVTVRQGQRWGTAERADYHAAEGKFVLSGGKPTLYDASGNTATGRELTFFLADDKILIDSGEGSRTLTKHRVEK